MEWRRTVTATTGLLSAKERHRFLQRLKSTSRADNLLKAGTQVRTETRQNGEKTPDNPQVSRHYFLFLGFSSSAALDIYAVNGIAFHPAHGTLATVGSDGRFSFWDKDARTKLKTSEQLDQPISACCFNHNGNIFAYASSYDWSKVRVPRPALAPSAAEPGSGV